MNRLDEMQVAALLTNAEVQMLCHSGALINPITKRKEIVQTLFEHWIDYVHGVSNASS